MPGIWDWRARIYDVCEGSGLRRGPAKAELFSGMRGRVLFVAIGTGLDIRHFPPDHEIVAVDISEEMLRRAEPRRLAYSGDLQLVRADAMALPFPDAAFDSVVTSCTMCSVPDPVRVLRELFRVLRPGGEILMFEHVRSQGRLFGLTLDLMTLWTRLAGTEMNRDSWPTSGRRASESAVSRASISTSFWRFAASGRRIPRAKASPAIGKPPVGAFRKNLTCPQSGAAVLEDRALTFKRRSDMMVGMFDGAFMGLAGMMSFIGPLLMMTLTPFFNTMGQMFGAMFPQ